MTTPLSSPFIDTNVIVGFVAKDEPEKRLAARRLFQQIERGEVSVVATSTIIADCVFVLSSPRLYSLDRREIANILMEIVHHTGFYLADRQIVSHALRLYGYSNIKFDDAYIIAAMATAGSDTLYSWDRGFDRIPGINRIEP